MSKIPTRQDIYDQIQKIKIENVGIGKQDIITQIAAWLDSQNLPQIIMIAGGSVNPKESILDDLESYENL